MPDIDELRAEHRSVDSYTESRAAMETVECIDPGAERDTDIMAAIMDASATSVTTALKH